jgi:hypothetical protein
LEPGAHREALVEGQPNKRAHLFWAGLVPDSRNHLRGCGVLEIEPLDKGEDVWGVRHSPCILVAPFGGVAKEGGVS